MPEPLAAAMPRSRKTLPKRPRVVDTNNCLLEMCNHVIPHPITHNPIFLRTKAIHSSSYVCTPYRYVPQVPQELIDTIIDYIDDMATLKACSLVCWAFVPASRTHIFHTVCLEMLHDAPAKFFAILARNPHLEVYIRDLTIYRDCGTDLWMKPGSPLPAILSMLNHVERFSLLGCWGDWKDIPRHFANAIHRVISLRTLDRLHLLTASNVPPAVLNSALSVRVLSMFHVSVDSKQNVKRSLRLPHIRDSSSSSSPEFLNLSVDSKVGTILEYMRAPGSAYFANVRRLAINPIPNSPNSAGNFAKVLSSVETTLERLDVQIHESHYEPFDTSKLNMMRALQLHIIKKGVNTIPELLVPFVARLRAMNPRLQSLTIVIHLPFEAVDAGLDYPCVDRLKAIDFHLSDEATGFTELKEVLFKIVAEASPPTLLLNYPSFVSDHLPRTRARGILKVEEGTRVRDMAVMPLLPYTGVWPHRSKKNDTQNSTSR
ncbi:hypothetical protein MIND_00595200 [Mycena indigotica]|uniref:F-box domain-containing protein n=1 Tax=Mycena indigotica TaxID=2126181 RepID=A0A8H6SPW5_9AGAR|nr:uncharacterized protein MIND_00595200 [Mycena indigotica]KAF7303658.1 hypothetical protein MIND_00595200 [Mycena indigotica]